MNKKRLSIIVLLIISILGFIIGINFLNSNKQNLITKNENINTGSNIDNNFPPKLISLKNEIEKGLTNEPELSGKNISFKMIKNNEYEYSLNLQNEIDELGEINLNYFITSSGYNGGLLTNNELSNLGYTGINILNGTGEMLKLSEILKSQLTNSMIQYTENKIEYKLQFSKKIEFQQYLLSCYKTQLIDYTYEQEDDLGERCLIYKDNALYGVTYTLND